MKKNSLFSFIILILAVFVAVYAVYFKDSKKPLRLLPIYGQTTLNEKGDSVYHSIQKFSFTNQQGVSITEHEFDNCIYVADFFFTTCHSICPVMSKQMEKIASAFTTNKNVKILSHTVDPEEDNIQALAAYAKLHNANPMQWYFVTGKKKELYDMARYSYLVNADEGDGGADDFIHTQLFVLIDKEKHIRGYYDGTNEKEVKQLINDIGLLLKEYN